MRGKDGISHIYGVHFGITPAYAGKRQIWIWESWGNGDHPRLCGEKRYQKFNRCPQLRITPAYAGKRSG